jgi:8-oxo-dGTP diphosphatase
MKPRILVSAAVIERDGAFLLTRRLEGTHLAGYWEFPGGKCDPDESVAESLVREIREELDAEVTVGDEILACTHEYDERIVELRFFLCELRSEPRAVLGQAMEWVPGERLADLPLPPADDELVRLLTRGRGPAA